MNSYYTIALANLEAINLPKEKKQPLLNLAHFLMGREA